MDCLIFFYTFKLSINFTKYLYKILVKIDLLISGMVNNTLKSIIENLDNNWKSLDMIY